MAVLKANGSILKANGKVIVNKSLKDFFFLNNCDYLINDNKELVSLVGPNLQSTEVIGSIVDSVYFHGDKSFQNKVASTVKATSDNINLEDGDVTLEIFISDVVGSGYANWQSFGFSIAYISVDYNRYNETRISLLAKNSYELFNGASLFAKDSTYVYFFVPVSARNSGHVHLAFVLKNDGFAYAFVNGTLFAKTYNNSRPNSFNASLGNNERSSPNNRTTCDFISARKGDFSNNLSTFDVPTNKYK